MSTDRRYSEQEVAYILERATKADVASADASADAEPQLLPSAADTSGMTLAQLHEIAAEVGISASAVTDAVRSVERGDIAPTELQRFVGLPVRVGRTITIDRAVTDAEWERIVVALRETFNARGTVAREGSLRHWSNGNLHAMLEPTSTGYRLRLQTTKGDARMSLLMGTGATLVGLASALSVALSSAAVRPGVWLGPALVLGMGGFLLARTVFGVGPWARERATQMEALAETITRILDESRPAALPSATDPAAK